MTYGLIGERLSHSRSPLLHGLLGDPEYTLHELAPDEVEPFLREKAFSGLNVTIPYKRAAAAVCDRISPIASRVGAVNTLVVSNKLLCGYNTDYVGFQYLAERAGVAFTGRKVLLLGTGGAAAVVRAVCEDAGAREIVQVSRHGPVDYEAMYDHTDAEVMVNATPRGMWPDETPAADPSRFPNLCGVLDLVYNPLRTPLLQLARTAGIPAMGGLPMLAKQAVASRERFLGRTFPAETAGQITDELSRRITHLTLIGMPGAGKTTLGRLIASRLNRRFVDCDEELEKQFDVSIEELFRTRGEACFRAAEKALIQKVAAQSDEGIVLATGGGAILDAQNVVRLRSNSLVCHLRRPVEQLPLEGRPLSVDRAALERLAKKRVPLYNAAADFTVDNTGTPDETAAQIINKFRGLL